MPLRHLLIVLTVLPSAAVAQEWTRFRGPNGSGVRPAAVPDQWTEKDFRWKVRVPICACAAISILHSRIWHCCLGLRQSDVMSPLSALRNCAHLRH